MATAAEARPANPVTVFRQTLQTMQPELKMALPSHIAPEKFARVAQTAVNNSPDLLDCDRKSLFGAIVRLAQDGLLPDGREAALVKFRTKENGQYVNKVQAMPMIYGILKKLRQSGEIAKVSAQVVYEKDEFVWHLGFDEDVTHNPPPLDQPRGKAIGAYATAVLRDGSRLLEVMSLEEIERVRAVSRSKDNEYGPWVNWWGEMARKTVMRRLAKRLPMSSDLYEEVTRDETAPPIDHRDLRPAPAQVSRLDAIEHQIADAAVEGEVVEEPKPRRSRAKQPDLIEEGRADGDHGDQHDGTLDQALDALGKATTTEAVNAIVTTANETLSPEEQEALSSAAMARISELEGGL